MILDPAPVSVIDEPYSRALEKYNNEVREAQLAEHAKKLAAASRPRRFFRWLRRKLCCCLAPLEEEIPPVFTPAVWLPCNVFVQPDGELIRFGSAAPAAKTEERPRPPYRLV
jgi:hypothetical protein